MRWPAPEADAGWRRATGTLQRWTETGDAIVRWTGLHGGARGTVTQLDAQEAADCMVRAGAIAAVPMHVGANVLVGRRISVYFPAMDEMYNGVVTAWHDGVHHVKYDDGDSSDWSLYWPSGAPAFVLLDA